MNHEVNFLDARNCEQSTCLMDNGGNIDGDHS